MADQDVIVIADSDDEVTVSNTASADVAATSATARKEVAPQHEGASSSSVENTEKEQMECPICLQTCIHPARLPCGHIFCFLCVKGVAYKNRRCAMCRREIPVEFLDHPHLLYKIEETPPTSEDGYQWFYEGRNGWWQYDERTSQEIEDAYKRPDKFCTILVAGYVYVVDFETMLQQRQNEPSRKRQVKRDLATVPKKGVAGLRIDGTADPLESSSASVVVAEAAASSYPYHPFHQRDDSAGAGVVATAVATAASMTGGIGDGSPRSPLPALVAHNLISTIAATDAAIRIASDIIDSTLAHASTDTHGSSSAYDYHDGSGAIGGSISGGMAGRRANGHASSGSVNHRALSPCSNGSSRQDLLNEVQEALNISGHGNTSGNGSMGGICPSDHHHHRAGAAAAVAASSTSPRLDFFSQTIDEFRSLALSNIAESSADSDSELDDRDDGDNSRNNIGDGDNGLVVATSAAAHMGDTTSGGTINGLNI